MADPTQPAQPAQPAEPVQPPPPPEPEKKPVGGLLFDISERASSLVREEIELAKAEVFEKVGSILRGSAVGIAAGVFAFLALILAMHGFAWLLNDLFFGDNVWPGYFIEAAIFLLIAAGAGLFAFRAVQAGAPPVPEQAIEEAKRTKAALSGEPVSSGTEPVTPGKGAATAPGGSPAPGAESASPGADAAATAGQPTPPAGEAR